MAGAWVGGESPKVRFRSLSLGSGSNMALPIWGQFMQKINRDKAFATNQYNAFNPLSDSLTQILDCAPYLDEMPIYNPEEVIFVEDDSEDKPFEKAIEDIIKVFKKQDKKVNERPRTHPKTYPNTRSKESERVRRENERMERKREQKKKRKKFFDKVFKGNK